MTTRRSPNRNSRFVSAQRGQTFIPIMVFIGLVLLAMLGIAVDYSQVWAHRQMAQGAADAACQAGAADLYLNATAPGSAGNGGVGPFTWIGTAFDCSAKASTPPCQYASFNGYTGANVSVSFPSSLPNVPPLTGPFTVTNPYIQVTVTDKVSMSLSQLAGNASTVQIKAVAGCGVSPVSIPVPLVVLHPTMSGSLSIKGSASIAIIGGSSRAIQVNSSSTSAVNTGTIDLSQAGPKETGADFAVFGNETDPGGINFGLLPGKYIPRASPISDPFATVLSPLDSGGPAIPAAGKTTLVAFTTNGCPDTSGCVEYTAGDYRTCSTTINYGGNGCLVVGGVNITILNRVKSTVYNVGDVVNPNPSNAGNYSFQATVGGTSSTIATKLLPLNFWPQAVGATVTDGGVTWQNIGVLPASSNTSIFDPGLYVVGTNGLDLSAPNTTARPSTATGDGSGGTTFFFSNGGTFQVGSNSGKQPACVGVANGCIVSYDPTGGTSFGVTSPALRCPSGSPVPSQVPNPINGTILLAPCGLVNQGISGVYGSPDGNRGFLFFANRSTANNPSWNGGGQFLLSGFMYFHSTSYASVITMKGNPSSASYTLGNIVVDQVAISGTPAINMILNPTATFKVLKPSLLQ